MGIAGLEYFHCCLSRSNFKRLRSLRLHYGLSDSNKGLWTAKCRVQLKNLFEFAVVWCLDMTNMSQLSATRLKYETEEMVVNFCAF